MAENRRNDRYTIAGANTTLVGKITVSVQPAFHGQDSKQENTDANMSFIGAEPNLHDKKARLFLAVFFSDLSDSKGHIPMSWPYNKLEFAHLLALIDVSDALWQFLSNFSFCQFLPKKLEFFFNVIVVSGFVKLVFWNPSSNGATSSFCGSFAHL